jgi:hypothetical protein
VVDLRSDRASHSAILVRIAVDYESAFRALVLMNVNAVAAAGIRVMLNRNTALKPRARLRGNFKYSVRYAKKRV